MKIRDKYGYPVEICRGKVVHNLLRYIFVGNLRQTLKNRHKKTKISVPDGYTLKSPTKFN